MDIEVLMRASSDAELVCELYKQFDENSRLNRSPAAKVEFITTTRYIGKYLKPGNKLLDIGAGAGEYSLHYANEGYSVTAVELADVNIKAFEAKIEPKHDLRLIQGNALDLSMLDDESFDVVLVFGPLYHLSNKADRAKCICEAKRVCKPDGTILFAFISHDFIFVTELANHGSYFMTGDYDHDTMRLHDFPFVFATVPECRDMLTSQGIRILHEVAADGVSELMADKINAMDAESYSQYLRYHAKCCEKPELLGMTNHLLFVGKKQ